MIPRIGDSHIPTVGEPMEVLEGNLQAVFRCKCKPDNRPMFLNSTYTRAACPECGAVFMIAMAVYDITQGDQQPQIGVAIIGKMVRKDAAEGEHDGAPEKSTTRSLIKES